MGNLTHKELVDRAAIWLQKTLNCKIVAKELVTYAHSMETPDAIGWISSNNRSILVECKTSRSDFLKDKKKPARDPRFPALGNYRVYLTNQGIVKELKELAEGWSLYEVHGKRIMFMGGRNLKTLNPIPFPDACLISEKDILLSIIKRSTGYKPLIVDSSTYKHLIEVERI